MTDPKPRSAEELQAILMDTIRKVQSGELTPAEANAITRGMNAELRTIEAAMKAARTLRRITRS